MCNCLDVCALHLSACLVCQPTKVHAIEMVNVKKWQGKKGRKCWKIYKWKRNNNTFKHDQSTQNSPSLSPSFYVSFLLLPHDICRLMSVSIRHSHKRRVVNVCRILLVLSTNLVCGWLAFHTHTLSVCLIIYNTYMCVSGHVFQYVVKVFIFVNKCVYVLPVPESNRQRN